MKTAIVTIIVFFLCLFFYIKLAGPIPFFINSIQTTKTALFQVDGVGKIAAVPDMATISYGVTKNAATVADAQNQTNTLMEAIVKQLMSRGVTSDEIKTTGYLVNPNYGTNQNINGYTVTQTVDVHVTPIEKTNSILDSITASGANIIGQVQFGFTDTTTQKLEDEARKMAVIHAKSKAQSLAGAAGIHLGTIVDVSETPELSQPRILPLGGETAQLTTSPTNVTPGQNEVAVTVTLFYQTY